MSILRSHRSAQTFTLLVVFTAYWLIVLRLDASSTLGQQVWLGALTWVFLIGALALSPPAERVQVCTMVVVATGFEVLGSIIWGLYRYRLENLPMFVPPGHGLFFLLAVRLAALPWIKRHVRQVVLGVTAFSLVLMARGVLLEPNPDQLGLASWVVLLWFLVRSELRAMFAVSFVLTMALEFYGTAVGNWRWLEVVPYLGITAANPPAAIGAGYCIMDALARRLAPEAELALRRRSILAGAATGPRRRRGYNRRVSTQQDHLGERVI